MWGLAGSVVGVVPPPPLLLDDDKHQSIPPPTDSIHHTRTYANELIYLPSLTLVTLRGEHWIGAEEG